MEQSYYIYAKVEREGKGGNYLLSPDPLPFETTTHYHLLVGTLSSLIDGDRAYNRLYGFSMVTPGQILTDTISSANGNMTIDLQNGSIISDQIEFRRPDGSTKAVDKAIDDLESKIPAIWEIRKYMPSFPNMALSAIELSQLQDAVTIGVRYYRNNVDVTAIMEQSSVELFHFERFHRMGYDDNHITDAEWNLANRGRTQITLTRGDIAQIADIQTVADDEVLEEEYQKIKEIN